MIQTRRGTIIKELFSREGIKGFIVSIGGQEERCIAYSALNGEIMPGDEVLLNTTAQALHLGSGGYHYIISALDPDEQEFKPGGHIMKLRYTPMQIKVLSIEEEDSDFREEMLQADSLDGVPVLVTTLHSMLAPLCLELIQNGLKVAYVMTDGAALPLVFSQTVDWLKRNKLLVGTVTVGNAFGGDLEAVNVYSGMLAARTVLGAEVIIVGMGPGIVGTGTKWGFTGIEQGDILNAVDTLSGVPIAVPRISFADQRIRHRGISHHTITVLSRVCRVKALVPLPLLDEEKTSYILEQVINEKLFDRYAFCMEDANNTIKLIKDCELKISTMGREADQEKEFFMTLGAAAKTAAHVARGEEPHYIKLA